MRQSPSHVARPPSCPRADGRRVSDPRRIGRWFAHVLPLTLALSCGGSAATGNGAHTPNAAPAPVDLAAARADLSAWVDRMWQAYVSADMNAYEPTVGTNLFTWSTSAKVSLGYKASLADTESDFTNFRQLAKKGASLDYHEVGRDIGITEDGRAAWVVTEKEAVLGYKGESHHLAIVSTGVMVKDAKGAWKKVHSHSGARLPMFAVASLAHHKKLPAPADIGTNIGAGADILAARFRDTATNLTTFSGTVSDNPHTQFAFGNAGTYLVGGASVKKAIAGLSKAATSLEVGQLRAELVAPSMGWVSANMTANFGKFVGAFRASVIYVLEGGAWNAVQVHFSFGHAASPPFTPGANVASCDTESQLQSSASDKQTLLRFRNLSKTNVQVHWIDDAGKRQKLLSLAPGGEAMHQTWISYPFLVSDDAGKCLTIFFGRPRPTSAVYLGPTK